MGLMLMEGNEAIGWGAVAAGCNAFNLAERYHCLVF